MSVDVLVAVKTLGANVIGAFPIVKSKESRHDSL